MPIRSLPFGPLVPIALGLVSLAGLTALGVFGWAAHGEAIFLSLAQGAWLTCF